MMEVPLTRGYVALVDAEDYERVMAAGPWYAERDRSAIYAVGCNKRMHRFLMGLVRGDRRIVDHINHDGLDNRKSNLRIATVAENNRNRRKITTWRGRPVASPYKGIHASPSRKMWYADIYVNGKLISLGSFADQKDAALAYDKAAIEHWGQFAVLNFTQAEALAPSREGDNGPK
jgi:hypothetical protein